VQLSSSTAANVSFSSDLEKARKEIDKTRKELDRCKKENKELQKNVKKAEKEKPKKSNSKRQGTPEVSDESRQIEAERLYQDVRDQNEVCSYWE
jgi:predicted  nucleic acid-binding Zn-ribbon protein